MKERGIIMQTKSVIAILEGRKTQTRRVMKPQPVTSPFPGMIDWKDGTFSIDALGRNSCLIAHCPYGAVGDILWVRETFMKTCDMHTLKADGGVLYRATYEGEEPWQVDGDGFRKWNADGSAASPWKPSIFMPRWASRITLEITEIRVQRLQEISHVDAAAEGMDTDIHRKDDGSTRGDIFGSNAVKRFATLWDSINAKKHPWENNPWVWVLTFKKIEELNREGA